MSLDYFLELFSTLSIFEIIITITTDCCSVQKLQLKCTYIYNDTGLILIQQDSNSVSVNKPYFMSLTMS